MLVPPVITFRLCPSADRTGLKARSRSPGIFRTATAWTWGLHPTAAVPGIWRPSIRRVTLRDIWRFTNRIIDCCFGDMVSTLSSVVIAPLDGDLAVYLASLERLRRYDCRLLLPAHGT